MDELDVAATRPSLTCILDHAEVVRVGVLETADLPHTDRTALLEHLAELEVTTSRLTALTQTPDTPTNDR